jgi:predicted phosphodiesterase
MVASVAVLSDIHGVLPALDAVLAEPDVTGADRIILTGDIAAGPQPVDVLDRLLDLGNRVTWVRGNADRELVELATGADVPVPDEISPWAAPAPGPPQADHQPRQRRHAVWPGWRALGTAARRRCITSSHGIRCGAGVC